MESVTAVIHAECMIVCLYEVHSLHSTVLAQVDKRSPTLQKGGN